MSDKLLNAVIPIQGLEEYSNLDIEQMIVDFAKEMLNDAEIQNVEIIGAKVYGSRTRGFARSDSDLDIALEYKGDIREDEYFSMIHNGSFTIRGIPVDINPITEYKSGTLEEYLERANNYVDKTSDYYSKLANECRDVGMCEHDIDLAINKIKELKCKETIVFNDNDIDNNNFFMSM